MALFHDLDHELNTQYGEYMGDSSALSLGECSVQSNWYQHFARQSIDLMLEVLGDDHSPVQINVINGSVGRLCVDLLSTSFAQRVSRLANYDVRVQFSDTFQKLLQSGAITWQQLIEGAIMEERTYSLPDSCNKEKIGHMLLSDSVSFALIDGDIPKFAGIDQNTVSVGGHVILATRELIKAQPGFSLVKQCGSSWKISHDTIRKTRVVQLFVSLWTRNEVGALEAANSLDTLKATNSAEYYENDDVVRSYEKFHFDPGFLGVPNFSKAVAEFALKVSKKHGVPMGRALDIGAGPARSAIEMALAGGFKDVTAIDFSNKLIDLAIKHAPSFDIPKDVTFRAIVGDAHKLVSEEPYDCVIAINLIDRLETPTHFIDGIKPLMSAEGILIIASPYTWHERFTPKEKWLGGFGSTTTLQGLAVALAPEFVQLGEAVDIPFVIPDADGAYQFTKSQASVWKRK